MAHWFEDPTLSSFEPRLLALSPQWDEEQLTDLRCLACTPAAATWLNIDSNTVLQTSLLDSLPSLFNQSTLQQLNALLHEHSDQNVIQTELVWLDHHETGRTLFFIVEVQRHQDHLILHLISKQSRHSISWQSTREQALNDLTANILEILPLPVFVKDDEHRWVMGNSAFCDLLGLTSENLIGRSDYDFFPKEQADIFWEKDEEVMRNNRPVVNEEALTDSNNVQRWILTHKIPLTVGQDRTGLLGVITDITQRKLAEQQLVHVVEARNRLIDVNETKSRFMARMSHELRTPLNAIIGYSELIEEEAEDADVSVDDLLPDVSKIQHSAYHLLSLITDVLDLSKIEQGKLTINTGTFDLKSMLEETISKVSPMIDKSTCTLLMTCEPSQIDVHSDKKRLQQAVLNLLSNAVKFSKQGTIELNALTQDGDLIIQVKDDGPGLSKKAQATLFVPFESVDRDGNALLEGTGLGLSLTRHLCNLLGGDVHVQSTQDQGATFIIRVPCQLDVQETTQHTKLFNALSHDELLQQFSEQHLGNHQTILIIDDDERVFEFLQRFTSEHHIHLISCKETDKALEHMRRLQVDLILLNPQLEQVDAIKQSANQTPIVLIHEMGTSTAPKDVQKPLTLTQWHRIQSKYLAH